MIVVGMFSIAGVIYYIDNYMAKDDTKVKFEVSQGEDIVSISRRLKEKGVISSELLFKAEGLLSGGYKNIKYGVHLISEKDKYSEIYRKLSGSGVSEDTHTKVTIPEGYNVKQIAQKLADVSLVDKDKFLDLAKEGNFDFWFLNGIPKIESGYRVEGFLYPQTYYFEDGVEEKEIINTMLKEFENETIIYKGKYSAEEFYKIMKVASIVERETSIEDERAIVAGIFYNRLRNDMKLESCATVEYVLNTRKKVLSAKDISIDSNFNTYKYKGLTPTPISSPSKNSIEASMNPVNTEYLFFVANKDGDSHVFAKDYKQHLENIKKFR